MKRLVTGHKHRYLYAMTHHPFSSDEGDKRQTKQHQSEYTEAKSVLICIVIIFLYSLAMIDYF